MNGRRGKPPTDRLPLMDHIKKHAPLLITIMLGVFLTLSLSLAWQESTTFDEKAHVGAAYSYVRFGDMRLNPEHPPLLKDLAGIPLLFLNPAFPSESTQWTDGTNEQWSIGERFIHENDADRIMFWSRFPMILVALLLGVMIYRWTKELAGTIAGLFALLLYVADPNVIAHGHYVTTDLGIAAAIFATFPAFLRFLKDTRFRTIVVFGLLLGVAQLTKFSAILLLPYFGGFIVLYALTRRKPDAIRLSKTTFLLDGLLRSLIRYIGTVAVCFATVWILYYLNTLGADGNKIASDASVIFAQDNPASLFARETVISLSGSVIGKPIAQYLLGAFMVFGRVAGGHTHYFLGAVTNLASPWYFPTVFLLKETIPFLFLLLASSVYTAVRIGKALLRTRAGTTMSIIMRSVQSHTAQYAMFGFVAFYTSISIVGNLNIGFRHLFPILPLIVVLIAKTVTDIIRRQGFQGEYVGRVILGVLSFLIATIPILAYPSYLSYFNRAAGGPNAGYRFVTDSNYDWGQDMKRLRIFVTEFDSCKTDPTIAICEKYTDILSYPPIETIRTAYFGGADPAFYLGDRYTEWYADWGRRSGWHAISVNIWQESLYRNNPEGKETYQWIVDGGYPLTWHAGDSIFVYYIPPFPEDI